MKREPLTQIEKLAVQKLLDMNVPVKTIVKQLKKSASVIQDFLDEIGYKKPQKATGSDRAGLKSVTEGGKKGGFAAMTAASSQRSDGDTEKTAVPKDWDKRIHRIK